MLIGKASFKDLPEQPGLVKLIHIPTGSFFLANTTNIKQNVNSSYNGIKAKRHHCNRLNELVVDIETELGVTFIPTEMNEQARAKKHRIMVGYYRNPVLLNTMDWPKLMGAYRIIHRATGQFLVGYGASIAPLIKNHFQTLSEGTHSSPKLQALWDTDRNRGNYHIEWCHCATLEEAKAWSYMQHKLGVDLCLNSDRYHRDRPVVGVYKLILSTTGAFYVGSSVNMYSRVTQHKHLLRKGTNTCTALQRAYDENPGELTVEYIPCLTRAEAYVLEQRLIEEFKDDPLCMNISLNAECSALGLSQNEAIRKSKSLKMQAWHAANKEQSTKTTTRMQEMRSHGVMYDGTLYRSLRKAWHANGKNWDLIYKRLNNPDDLNVYLVNEPKTPHTQVAQ